VWGEPLHSARLLHTLGAPLGPRPSARLRCRGGQRAGGTCAAQGLSGMQVLRFIGHGYATVTEVIVAPGHAGAADQIWERALADRRSFMQLLEYRAAGRGLLELRRREMHADLGARHVPHDRHLWIVGGLPGPATEEPSSRSRGRRPASGRTRRVLVGGDRLLRRPARGRAPRGEERLRPRRGIRAAHPLPRGSPASLHRVDARRHGASRRLAAVRGALDGQAVAFDVVLAAAGTCSAGWAASIRLIALSRRAR
jgi:hypothetical protein